MRPAAAKPKSLFLDVVNGHAKPLELDVVSKLKEKSGNRLQSGDRIGFGTKSGVDHEQSYKLIYATPRTKRPGVLKNGWNQLIGRAKKRKFVAMEVLARIQTRIDETEGAAKDPAVGGWLKVVRKELMASGSTQAIALHALLDGISDVEKANAAKEEQRRLDMAVKKAAQFVMAEAELGVLGLPNVARPPSFRRKHASDFQAFILAACESSSNPRDYALARPFAEQWISAEPEHMPGDPRTRHLIDSLVKLVLHGCKIEVEVPPAVEQAPQEFTFSEDGKFTYHGTQFERGRLLGVGGNAATYLYTSENGTQVAVKELRTDNESSRQAEAQVEAQTHNRAQAGGGNHVVGIHGTVKTPDGNLMLVLEYAPSGDGAKAAQNIKAHPALDESAKSHALKSLFADMAQGVKQAHDNGIMHLDIKPSNFFIDADGKPLLGDFGTSRAGLAAFMRSPIDSPDYTAPELIQGRVQDTLVTERADIWSLGVMLFEFTKGAMPFPFNGRASESYKLILDFAGKDELGRFEQLGLNPADQMDRLIVQMLDPDPLKRPSAEAVLAHPLIAPAPFAGG